MPRLDDAGIASRQVNLPELVKEFVIAPQNFHEPTSFVGVHFQLLDYHAFNHLVHLAPTKLSHPKW
jgi:hypothetical protein